MSLEDFQSIYYVEYAHRVLGRVIGLAFGLPLLFFAVAGRVGRELLPKLLAMFALGALQGLLGWYMVQSGLVDEPRVSQYRLTAHLGLAVLIYGYILWTALGLLEPWPRSPDPVRVGGPGRLVWWVVGGVGVMILSGGMVAGTRAGYAFNTFPLMNGQWLPPGALALEPWWRNLFENIATVQFVHRVLAVVVAALVLLLWRSVRAAGAGRRALNAAHLLLGALVLQVALGITTLIYVVPVPVAAMHQGGALLLLSAALITAHRLWRPVRCAQTDPPAA